MRSRIIRPLRPSRRPPLQALLPISLVAVGVSALLFAGQPAFAIGTTVNLGTAGSYSVLGGQEVTNTGSSVLSRNVGVSPGTSVSGFPPGSTTGVIHAGDAHALQAQEDLTTAYNAAAGQMADATVGAELGDLVLPPGVYAASSSAQITGPLTLDAGGDPNAVFIFQIASALTTASSSSVVLLNDAQSCHVFWQIGSSATLGTDSSFVGTIMAQASITVNTGATVQGRALARDGAVTLDSNVFTDVTCATTSSTPSVGPSETPTGTGTATPPGTTTATPTGTGTATPPGTTTATPTGTGTATPTGTTTATPTGTRTPTPTRSSPVAGPGDNGSDSDSTGGPLPNTGAGPVGPLIAIAVGTALAGLAMILVARRRRIPEPNSPR